MTNLREGLIVLAALLLVFASGNGRAGNEDWPGFRGSLVDGTSRPGLLNKKNVGLKQAWNIKTGSGYSSLAIAGETLVSTFTEGEHDVMAAFDEKTGKRLWTFTIAPYYKGHDGGHDGPIATPLIADGRVFGLGAKGQFFGLDLATGKKLWSHHLVEDFGGVEPYYGFATSPIMMEGVLVLMVGAKDGAFAGFEPSTGKKLWQSGSDDIHYQTPIPWQQDGAKILAAGTRELSAIDPKTGAVSWHFPHQGNGGNGAQSLVPIPLDDQHIFLSHRRSGSALFKLNPEGDGALETVWENNTIRNSYNVPVLHNGYLYAFSSRFLTCVEARTGEQKWRTRQPGDGFLMLLDDHLVIVTKDGSLHVAGASPEGYQEVASLKLFDHLIWSPPSFANQSLYVRGLGSMAKIEFSAQQTRMAVTEVMGDPKGPFRSFLEQVSAATDKKSLVDAFESKNGQWPLVEADGTTHFLYRGPGEDVAVAGDPWGLRQEQVMRRVPGTDLFYHSEKFPLDASLTYLFIVDYKDKVRDSHNARQSESAIFTGDMEMNFSGGTTETSVLYMPKFQKPDWISKPPKQKGTLEAGSLKSQYLEDEISYQVYLPEGYKAGEKRYPTAYMLMGDAALERGYWREALDHLTQTKIAPTIVVFVKPFRARRDDLGKIIVEDLVPKVDGDYRTLASTEHRAVIGAGMAGSVSLFLTLAGNTFSKVGTHTALIFDSDMIELIEIIGKSETRPTVYMDWGRYGFRNPQEAWDMGQSGTKMAEVLKKAGYPVVTRSFNDGPGWTNWQNRAGALLSHLFPL